MFSFVLTTVRLELITSHRFYRWCVKPQETVRYDKYWNTLQRQPLSKCCAQNKHISRSLKLCYHITSCLYLYNKGPQGEVVHRLWKKSSHIIYLNIMPHRDQEFALLYYKFNRTFLFHFNIIKISIIWNLNRTFLRSMMKVMGGVCSM